jgi:hypothetical protein
MKLKAVKAAGLLLKLAQGPSVKPDPTIDSLALNGMCSYTLAVRVGVCNGE